VRQSQRIERNFMMSHTYGWMGGRMGLWTVIAALVVVVLLFVVTNKPFSK
jgi:uncharacterized membrane protein